MEKFYDNLSFRISTLITRAYSTSFSVAVSFLDKDIREAVYSVYGFVRFADEIVDSFHNFDKQKLLEKFEADYYEAVASGISLNPVLHSFQKTVRKYNIPDKLVQAFLKSMKYDLYQKDYTTRDSMEDYIYGSAEVVGLMCLMIFLEGDELRYAMLEEPARKLGSAFQKVNFLRDLHADTHNLGRRYFPEITGGKFNEEIKNIIIKDIQEDFIAAYTGIKVLPHNARLGVLIAYLYYLKLLKKISVTPAGELINRRIRVPDHIKFFLMLKAYIKNRFNIL